MKQPKIDATEFDAIIAALEARPRLRFEIIAHVFGRNSRTICRIAHANGYTQTGRIGR